MRPAGSLKLEKKDSKMKKNQLGKKIFLVGPGVQCRRNPIITVANGPKYALGNVYVTTSRVTASCQVMSVMIILPFVHFPSTHIHLRIGVMFVVTIVIAGRNVTRAEAVARRNVCMLVATHLVLATMYLSKT